MSNRNATASWHGYSHQSKVGVLLALRKINKLLEKDKIMNNWIIKFESAEDIDIQHGSKIDSRHQVKAKKDGKYPNAYKDVLQEAYPKIDGKMIKRTQAFQYRSINDDKDKSPGNVEVDEDSRYLHTIVEVKGFGLSEKEFREIASPQATYESNPNKVQLYEYSKDEYFCNFSKSDEQDKLEDYCVKEIKKILMKENSVFKNMSKIHRNKFLYIVDALDNQVRAEHLKDKIGYPTLSLKEIYQIVIDTDEQERTNLQVMREALMKFWDDYVEDLKSNSDIDKISEIVLDDDKSIIQEIYLLDDDEFKEFIVFLNPDEKKIDELKNSQLLGSHMQADGIRDIMYRCIINIVEQKFDREYLGYRKGKYTISLINREQGMIKTVIKEISQKSEYLNKIYERNYLINGQINNQKITPGIIEEQDKINSNWRNENDKNKIHIMNQEMKFITATEAIKKINGG